jgi:hypothetical protein
MKHILDTVTVITKIEVDFIWIVKDNFYVAKYVKHFPSNKPRCITQATAIMSNIPKLSNKLSYKLTCIHQIKTCQVNQTHETNWYPSSKDRSILTHIDGLLKKVPVF